MAGTKEILFNEDGSYKTNEQYIAETQSAECATLMADMLILKTAADVIKNRRKGETDYAANVAIIQCDLMASGMSHELWERYGVVAR